MVRKPLADANRLLAEVTKCSPNSTPAPPPKRPAERTKILIKFVQGRFAMAFCDRDDVDIFFINEPDVAAANGLLAEQLVDESLPEVFRKVHCPGLVRAVGEVEKLSAAEIQWRASNMQLYDALAISRPDQQRISGKEAVQAALGVRR